MEPGDFLTLGRLSRLKIETMECLRDLLRALEHGHLNSTALAASQSYHVIQVVNLWLRL